MSTHPPAPSTFTPACSSTPPCGPRSGPPGSVPAEEAVLKRFAGWDERLRALVAHSDDPLRRPPRPRAARRRHRWAAAPDATLIGDAAHLMFLVRRRGRRPRVPPR